MGRKPAARPTWRPVSQECDAVLPPARDSPHLAVNEMKATVTGFVAIDALLATARQGLTRVAPADLDTEIAAGALVVDIRPIDQRERDGELPGALIIDRNVLEWRLDPTSPHRAPEVTADQRIIIVCNEGYSSSLAAATLQQLGIEGATDLIGGFQAWTAILGQLDPDQAP